MNFKITDGATIEPANGSMQDFTKGPVVYTVTSQDGEWKRTYNVAFQEVPLPAQKFSFELVETQTEKTMLGGTNEMHVFYEQTAAGPNYCWATGNPGSAITKNGSKPENFPTYSTPDGKEGRCVCLNTQSTGLIGEWIGKPIAAGNLFLGEFVVDYVLTDALKATRFGVPNSKEPVRITGWYKYKPGEKFTDMDMKEYPDRKDEASIYAVYYRNTDDKGESYVLDGHAVEDLDKVAGQPAGVQGGTRGFAAAYRHVDAVGDVLRGPRRARRHGCCPGLQPGAGVLVEQAWRPVRGCRRQHALCGRGRSVV